MAAITEARKRRRSSESNNNGEHREEEEEEEVVGPLPTSTIEDLPETKRTIYQSVLTRVYCPPLGLPYEWAFLENLPSASMYERSYMHRDVVTHIDCTK